MSLFNLFKKEKNMNQSNCISQESDTPIPFGMKISWLVVKEKRSKYSYEKTELY